MQGIGVPLCLPCYVAKTHEIYTDDNKDEWIECRECGLRAKEISTHVKNVHGINPKEYGLTKSKNSVDRVKGENNPGYQHGGKFSPWSKKSKFYSEESHKKAVENSHITGNSFQRHYYETDEEYSKSQTRDLDYFVKKYGEQDGLKRYAEKTEKWLRSLSEKSDEEKKRINRSKVNTIGKISKAEMELYSILSEEFSDLEIQFQINAEIGYIYDLRLGNRLIEYQGDYWHCNPQIYISDFFNKSTKRTAQQTWDRDKTKYNHAIENGYKILCVWETDYKKDKQGTIEKCKNFLKQSIENL